MLRQRLNGTYSHEMDQIISVECVCSGILSAQRMRSLMLPFFESYKQIFILKVCGLLTLPEYLSE